MASTILNFDPNNLITAINIVDDMLFFTDNKNEPKRIEIDTFRDADHSGGNTKVFGRKFKERDITVIRPMPLQNLDIGLVKTVKVPIIANPPQVKTLHAIPQKTSATLHGEFISNGTVVSNYGFFYKQSDTPLSIEQLKASENKVTLTTINSSSFNTEISNLTSGKRYYFLAFAFNNITEAIYATNVGTFVTNIDAATATVPSVNTLEPEKISAAKFKALGEITSDGGAPITDAGFFLVPINPEGDQGKPARLWDHADRQTFQAVQSIDDSDIYEFLMNSVTKGFWIQFWAQNRKGKAYGDVLGGEVQTPTQEQTPPTVIVKEARVITGGAQGALTYYVEADAQVLVGTPGSVVKAGMYFSKTKTTKNAFTNACVPGADSCDSDSGVYKIDFQNANISNVTDVFTLNESANTIFNFEQGDTCYIMAYVTFSFGTSQVTAYSEVTTISHRPIVQNTGPSVITIAFERGNNSTELDLKCKLKVSSNGLIGNDMTIPEGINREGGVEYMGFILHKATQAEAEVIDGLSLAEKQDVLKQALIDAKAKEFIFKDSQGNNEQSANVDVEKLFTNSEGSSFLEEGYYYYGMAFANNFQYRGYGAVIMDVIQPENAAVTDAVGTDTTIYVETETTSLEFITENIQANTVSSTDFNVPVKARIKSFGAGQVDIVEAGFAYQKATPDKFKFDTATYISLPSSLGSPAATSVGGSITELNNHINGLSGDKDFWEFQIPNSIFVGNYGETYSAQAFVTYESGGNKIKAKLQTPNATGGNYIDSISTFVPVEAVTNNYAVPSITCRASGTTSTGANVYANITQVTDQNNVGVSISDRKIYFLPASQTTAATDALKIADVISNGTAITSFDEPLNKDISGTHGFTAAFGKDFENSTGSFPDLEEDTEYLFVATAKNDSTANDPLITGQGAGVGVSNLAKHKTAIAEISPYWKANLTKAILGVENGNQKLIKFEGILNRPTVTSFWDRSAGTSLHIVEATDVSASATAEEIFGSPEAEVINVYTSDNLNPQAISNKTQDAVVWRKNDLNGDTAYKAIFKTVIPGYNEILSPVIDFTTLPQINTAINYSIGIENLPSKITFNANGEFPTEKQGDLILKYTTNPPENGAYAKLLVSPPAAVVKWEILKNPQGVLKVRTFTDRDGFRIVNFSIDQIAPPSNLRNFEVRFYVEQDPLTEVRVILQQTKVGQEDTSDDPGDPLNDAEIPNVGTGTIPTNNDSSNQPQQPTYEEPPTPTAPPSLDNVGGISAM